VEMVINGLFHLECFLEVPLSDVTDDC